MATSSQQQHAYYRRGNFHQYLPDTTSRYQQQQSYTISQPHGERLVDDQHDEVVEEADSYYHEEDPSRRSTTISYPLANPYRPQQQHQQRKEQIPPPTFGDFDGVVATTTTTTPHYQQNDTAADGHLQDPFAHRKTTSRTVSPPNSPSPRSNHHHQDALSTSNNSLMPFDQHLDMTVNGMRFYEDESASQPGKILPSNIVMMQQQRHLQQRPWQQQEQQPSRNHHNELSPLRMRRAAAQPASRNTPHHDRRPISPPSPLRSPVVRTAAAGGNNNNNNSRRPTTTTNTNTAQQLQHYRLAAPRISVPLNYPYGVDDDDDEDAVVAAADTTTTRMEQQQQVLRAVSPTTTSCSSSLQQHHQPRSIHDDEPSALTMPIPDTTNNNNHHTTTTHRMPPHPASEDDDSLFDFDGSRRSLTRDTGGGGGVQRGTTTTGRRSTRAATTNTTTNAKQQQQQARPGGGGGMGAKAAVFMAGMGAAAVAAVAGAGLPKDDSTRISDMDNTMDMDDDNPNTNHHTNGDDDDEFTYDTKEETVQSTYTKSAESEVEDIIKDIFMIGSGHSTKPGRRKVVREQDRGLMTAAGAGAMATHRLDETDDAPTIGTNEESATLDDATYDDTLDRTIDNDTTNGPEDDDDETTKDDYVAQTMEFVGTKISVAAAAIAWSVKQSMTTPDSKQNNTKTSSTPATTSSRSAPSSATRLVDVDQELDETTEDETTDDDHVVQTGSSKTRSAKQNAHNNKGAATGQQHGWDFFQAASDAIFGPEGGPGLCEGDDDDDENNPSLEEDVRLVDLAVQAAVSAHRLNGVEFDASHEIDIASEIKFSVVDLQLPLGLIFQENEKGCWITKILPDGNAARCHSNIQVGDQLAAVDGASAIDLTVDDIASLIRSKKKKKVIELTFVRYVGQLRPAIGTDVQEEGYEIQATEALPMTRPRRKKNLGWSGGESTASSGRRRGSGAASPTSSSPKSILKNSHDAMLPIRTMMMSEQAPPIDASLSPSTSLPSERSQSSATSGKKRFRLFGRRKQ